MSLAVMALLVAGCEDPDTAAYDPMGVAADQAGMTLTDVPLDQIQSCVESTTYNAFMGDRRGTEALGSGRRVGDRPHAGVHPDRSPRSR